MASIKYRRGTLHRRSRRGGWLPSSKTCLCLCITGIPVIALYFIYVSMQCPHVDDGRVVVLAGEQVENHEQMDSKVSVDNNVLVKNHVPMKDNAPVDNNVLVKNHVPMKNHVPVDNNVLVKNHVPVKNHEPIDDSTLNDIREKILKLRMEFEERYGGADVSKSMLERGLVHAELRKIKMPHSDNNVWLDLARTADRMIQAKEDSRPFTLAFGGYSVTVGRGNFFSQSYPFVLEKIVKEIFKDALGIDIVVRNAAIGGTPSFPYGWCLQNFLGDDADVVSWEFSMNEGNAADGFESYLRHSMVMPHSPKFLLMDTLKRGRSARMDVLKKYSEIGADIDSLFVDYENAIKPFVEKRNIKEDFKDLKGFNKWDKWGAPDSCPGRSPWHLKAQSHELIGWMLAMHFLDCIEIAINYSHDPQAREHLRTLSKGSDSKGRLLPEPISKFDEKSTTDLSSLRFGVKSGLSEMNETWKMNKINCRTSYDPILNGYLEDSVVSGMEQHKSILYERSMDLYDKGWVLDVGNLEWDTKRKVDKCGGLGYIDVKTALYGVSSSGVLKFQLPYDGEQSDVTLKPVKDLFKSLVICEVNEKKKNNDCQIERDVSFSINGVSPIAIEKLSFTGVQYLKQDICYSLQVPESITPALKSSDEKLYLNIDVVVLNEKIKIDGACSISHVIWESI